MVPAYGADHGGLQQHPSAVPTAVHQQNAAQPHLPTLLSNTRDVTATPESSASSQVPVEIQEALLPKVVTEQYQHPFSKWRRRYMVALVAVITALLCADQNLLAPNLSAAAAYFGLNDQQKDTYLGGYLMAAFFLIGAPAALVCGWLADKHNRIHLLVAIIVIGETPCLCTYWVTALWQFFLVRMLTGIAVGGCFPLVFSLLGDLFPVSQRSAMAALVQIAIGAGIGGGQMLAGIVGPATNWKIPFVVMAAPTLILAFVLFITTKEPPRGAFEEALTGQLAAGEAYSETMSLAKFKRMLKIPSNWFIVIQGLPGCLPWGVMQTYINDYLHLNKGLSVELATVVILLFGIGCGVGVIAGGAAGQLLYNWHKESMAILAGVSVLAGTAPVWAIINADLSFGACLALSALAGFLVSIAGPNLRAIMINVNSPETRGVALALQSVTDDLGRGLGPVIVAGFISQLGRVGAFNISVAGWLPCGVLLCCLACTMRKDEANMQKQLKQKSEIMLHHIHVSGADSAGLHMSDGVDDQMEPGVSAPMIAHHPTVGSADIAVAPTAAGKTGSGTIDHAAAQQYSCFGCSSSSSTPRAGVHPARQLLCLSNGEQDATAAVAARRTWSSGDGGHNRGQAHDRKASTISDPGSAGHTRISSRQQLLEPEMLSGSSSGSQLHAGGQAIDAGKSDSVRTEFSPEQDLAPAQSLLCASTRHRGSRLRGMSDSEGSNGSSCGRGNGSSG